MPQRGPQTVAIRRHLVTELFFGGAVGGGKSDFLLGDFAQDVPQPWGPHCRGILFRRTYGELEELISRSQEIYPPWFPGVEWKGTDKTWVWPNGATLKMRYLEHTTDWMRYWGHQYTWQGWDELPSWSDLLAYHKMKARLRSAHPIPNKRIRATGNPGGPGHQAVKAYFGIDRFPNGGETIRDEVSGTTRMFIRSRLENNAVLTANDPGYANRLRGLGSDALVRAWLDGDWNVIAGAYFDCWRTDQHVIHPFPVPAHWMRFASMDWGSAKPFSVQWWAVSDGDALPDGRIYPTGMMICYREWYGCTGEPNVGIKLTAEQLAQGIVERERLDPRKRDGNPDITYRVADPSCWKVDGGPSIAERMSLCGVALRPADNQRISGWDKLRDRLIGGEDEGPMVAWFSTCTDSIRTIPALQHDEKKPEDVETSSEDHCVVASTLVETTDGPKPIIDLVGTCGLLESIGGPAYYCGVRLTRRDAPVVAVRFSNGSEVTCTPDHRFATKRGWVAAKDLFGENVLVLSLSQNECSPFLANASTSKKTDISRTGLARTFIGRCGNTITAAFRQAATSITRMKIAPTTTLRTLPLSRYRSICASIIAMQRATPKASQPWLSRARRLISLTLQSCANGAALASSRAGLAAVASSGAPLSVEPRENTPAGLGSCRGHVSVVAQRSPRNAGAPELARMIAGGRCVAVEPVGLADVYCLSVPDTQTFAINGGAIVHNCGDSARYAAMSRPWTRRAPKPPGPLERIPPEWRAHFDQRRREREDA